MGFLDNLKDKAEDFGDKAKEGLGAAREKASELVGDVKDRFDGDDETPASTAAEPGIAYSPAAVAEAAGGESPLDTVGDLPEPDLGDVAAPGLGEVPDAVLNDLPEAPAEGLTPVDDGTGHLGNDKDGFGRA